MKKSSLIFLGLVSTMAASAQADVPMPNATPSLEFREVAFEDAPLKEHRVLPYRFYNKMIVAVWDPVACGQKPTHPAFSLQGNKLILSYSLSEAAGQEKQCTLRSEFQISNVPHQDLEVAFAGGPEPHVIATMKKCAFYKPTSDDRWECLAPTATN